MLDYIFYKKYFTLTKPISGEKYTQLAGLFVHLRRCKNGYIAWLCARFRALQINKILCQLGVYSWSHLKTAVESQ